MRQLQIITSVVYDILYCSKFRLIETSENYYMMQKKKVYLQEYKLQYFNTYEPKCRLYLHLCYSIDIAFYLLGFERSQMFQKISVSNIS